MMNISKFLGLSTESESDRVQEDRVEDDSSNSTDDAKVGKVGGAAEKKKAPSLGHCMSLPGTTSTEGQENLGRQNTAIEREEKGSVKRKNSVSWTPFGAIGKAVGGGVSLVGNATKAVGTGVVKGTQAVGSGVVSAAGTVSSGVVSAAETVGTGVAAVGTGVVKTGEAVGSAAVSGVTAVGEATKRTANTVSRSVDDSTTWVREKRRSVILHARPYKHHRVEEGETMGIIAAKYKTTVEDIISLNKDTLMAESELAVGVTIKVPVREKRKSSRKENSDNFLTNLSQTFAENSEFQGDSEQVESRCVVLGNHNLGPETISPGYLIIEMNMLVLTWGNDNPLHVEKEHLQGLSLLYTDDELTGYTLDGQPNSESIKVGSSFSESDVFPAWDEQPELEDSSVDTEDTSPRALKTENSDEGLNTENSKNLSFEDQFQMTELSRSKSDEKDPDERGPLKRTRSRKRTVSKDRRQSLMYEDTMATYLLIRLVKGCDFDGVKCITREASHPLLCEEEPEFLLRVPNEIVVRLFGILSRNFTDVYGSVNILGLNIITMDSLMSNNSADMKVATALGQKNSIDEGSNLPSMDESSQVFEPEEISAISNHLPPRVSNDCWLLSFSTHRDGFSLSTLYRKLQYIESPVLMAIEDVEENVFGCLLSEAPKITDAFTGTGESWLFCFPAESNHCLQVYTWTKKNELFCKGCSNSLAIGAGDGQFGIWFDEDLNHGRSQACETFDNPPLTPSQDFRVKCIECWTFLSTD